MLTSRPKRNQPCPCGSGKKFKKCCYGRGAEPDENQPFQLHVVRGITFPQLADIGADTEGLTPPRSPDVCSPRPLAELQPSESDSADCS